MSTHHFSLSRRLFLGAGGAVAAMLGLPAISMAKAGNPTVPSGLEHANVTLIAAALRSIGHDPKKLSMRPDIKPLVYTGNTMIGPVVITKWEAGKGPATQDDVRKNMFEPLDEAPRGSVWVTACDTEEIYSLFGDVIALACKRNGLAGALTDNGCRDIAGIESLQFPVFARSAVPFGPGAEDSLRPIAANVPVTCGGVKVRPGDLVAADIDGVIVIPKEAIADLEEAIPARAAKEEGIRIKIRAGEKLALAYTR